MGDNQVPDFLETVLLGRWLEYATDPSCELSHCWWIDDVWLCYGTNQVMFWLGIDFQYLLD